MPDNVFAAISRACKSCMLAQLGGTLPANFDHSQSHLQGSMAPQAILITSFQASMAGQHHVRPLSLNNVGALQTIIACITCEAIVC